MDRTLVNTYQAAQAALREAEDQAFLALEAEHAAELARIEAKADAAIAALAARVTTLEANRPPVEEPPVTPPPDEEEPPVEEPPVIVPGEYILYTKERIMSRPTTGEDWSKLSAMAKGTWQAPVFRGESATNNQQGDAQAIAGAIYAVRMNDNVMREKVVGQLKLAITNGQEPNWLLGLGRSLAGYVLAANIIQWADPAFSAWVHRMVTETFGDGERWGGFETILETNTSFNSNWATQCRRSVIVASMYLKQVGTAAQKADADKWLKLSILAHRRDIGIPGAYPELPPLTSAPTGWYGDAPYKAGINPRGTKKLIGDVIRYIGGARPSDWLRAKGPDGKEDRDAKYWPPQVVSYHWEGVSPQVFTAAILHQHGLVAFNEADNAIVRSLDALHGTGENAQNNPKFINPASGDDKSAPHVVNFFAGSKFPAPFDDMPDKAGMGWARWYFGGAS